MNVVPHAAQHQDANDAIEALEAKVGIDGSADTDSLDYRVAALEASGTPPVFEVPTGTINGVNTTFSISVVPNGNAMMLFSDGVFLTVGAGNDYTRSGLTLTLSIPPETSLFAIIFP